MKSIIALALFVSVALCNSTAHYGWIPNHELTFRWTTSQITGLEEIRAQYGGMELSSIIRVQVFSDYSLRIKFENSKFVVVNKDLPIVHGRPQIPEGSQELPEEFRRPLETAFMVHLKAGVIENLFVERDEPVVVTNIKKALLSQLQMDLSASRRQDIGSNEIPKSIMSDERPTFFTTEESSILGDCETIYTVNPLPKYQANELESRWIEEERELRELGILSGPKSEGDEACRGKTYYEVTKTRNFDNCRERPVFQQWIGLKSSCDVTKSNCKDMFTHLSSTRYIVCGSEEQFYIREANTENSIVSQPIGWNTEETLKSTARITLVLIKVKSGDFTPLPKPNQPKEKKSLVYQYPKANDRLSPEEATREVVPGSEGQSPFMPILPKPDMRSASNLIPNPIAKNELKTKIVEEIKDIVNKIHEETQSCANKGDVASYISTVVQSLRSLNYDDLKEIDHKITSSFSHGSQRVTAVEIFEDMLAMVGSNPCVLLLKEKIQGGRMESRNKAYLVGNAIRNVRTPTEELFKELFQMVKSVKGDRQAYQSGLLELSNLVYLACVNPSTSYNQYPVRIYGRFCNPKSSFITEQYIPYLEQQLQNRNSEKDVEQFVYISALGKLGHKNTLLPLTRVIEGKMSSKPMARSMAVYSLKRLAKLEPTVVRPVLLALIDNLAEHTEVRIAAVAVLPWSQPSVAELQKMALRSWFEPSKQVASFVYSTLKYLPQTEVPELKPVGLKAKTLLHLVKPFQYGIQFSHNIYSQKFVEYLRTAASSQLRYVITEESFVPTRVSFSTKLFGGLWEIRGLSFAIYTESMDKVMDKVFDYLGYKSEVTDKVEEQLNKVNEELKIQDRHGRTPAAMAQLKMLGLETFYALDVKTYVEILNLVSEKLRGAELSEGQTFQKTRLQNLLNLESFGPSEAGFLLYVRKTVPVVLAYKGSYSTSTGSLESRDSEKYFKAEVKPIANIKVETTFGVVSPFTKQFIGAGVEMGLHANGCSAVKAEINKPGQLTLTLKKPEQVNTKVELIHVFVKPYTFTRDLTRLVPTFKDSSAKTIMSTNLIKQEFKLGERFGVDLNAKFATDYRHFDFGYVINKMSYQNIQSAFHTGLMVPSIRYFSFQLVWDVEASQTKEIRTRISSVRGQHVEGGDLELLSEEGVSQEEHLRRICGESYQTQSEAEICHRQALGQLERAAETVQDICEEQSESGSLSDEKKRECRKAVHVCEQAKRICEESRRYEREICQDKKDQCLSKRRTIQHMERALQGQQTGTGRVHGLNFESSLRSAYHGERKVEVMGVFGRKVSNNNKDIKAFVDIKMTTPEHPVYEMEAISETKLPEVMYRWNLDSLLKEDINMKNRIVIKFGRQSADKHTIELKTNWEKTEAQKEAVRNSPEFKKCNEEFQANRMLSSVCMEARHQAASVDKVQFKIQAPSFMRHSLWGQRVWSAAEGYLMMNYGVARQSLTGGDRSTETLEGEMRVSRSGRMAELKITSPVEMKYHKITLPYAIRGFMPLSLRNGILPRLVQKVTRDQAPASCRIDPEWISTFDNKTYKYTMNTCEHLLFKDCSNKRPLAVLAEGVSNSYKNVKVILGTNIVTMNWGRKEHLGGKVDIKINGEHKDIRVGELYVKRSSQTGHVVLNIFRSKDSVVSVYNPEEGLEVFYDGKKIEIVAPQILHNRACGLCGDLNLENTADLQTPKQCLMRHNRFNAYTYMIKKNNCPGVPSEDREEFEHELSQCSRPKNLPTPLEKLTRASMSRKPITGTHLFKREENRICFSKRPIRVCTGNSRPEIMKTDVLDYACLIWPSTKAEQFLARAKAGEIIDELVALPTVYSDKHRVPSQCSSEVSGSEEFAYNYRTTPRY